MLPPAVPVLRPVREEAAERQVCWCSLTRYGENYGVNHPSAWDFTIGGLAFFTARFGAPLHPFPTGSVTAS
jgi:hypothetical protein